jgi:hypothetical protein
MERMTRWRAQGGRVMLFPLQLSSDYQIRAHSPFATMALAASHVLTDFAAHAPADMALLVKEHPLDATPGGWTGWITRKARALGQDHRIIPIPGGDLRALCEDCAGLVTVNSTSATFALSAGVPVAALGHAVYALPGLTHQDTLGTFWQAPMPPDPVLWDAFTRVLHHRCLIRGGLASSDAVAMAVENAAGRLVGGDRNASGGQRAGPFAIPFVSAFALGVRRGYRALWPVLGLLRRGSMAEKLGERAFDRTHRLLWLYMADSKWMPSIKEIPAQNPFQQTAHQNQRG